MLSKEIEKALNDQMTRESNAAQLYLSFGSWAEAKGYDGISDFLYHHMNEERAHMMKILKFINERGGQCKIEALKQPMGDPKNLHDMFEKIYQHEVNNSSEINNIVDLCFKKKDYPTNNFMQWFVKEQIEEEKLASTLLDKLKLIGDKNVDKGGLYEFDRHIKDLHEVSLPRESGND